MSAVITFPAERIKPAEFSGGGPCAEIVIFPGVRIERPEPATRTPPTSGRAARRRKSDQA